MDLPLASKTYGQLIPPTKTNCHEIQGHSPPALNLCFTSPSCHLKHICKQSLPDKNTSTRFFCLTLYAIKNIRLEAVLHQHIFFILVWLTAEHLPMFLVSRRQGAGAGRILGINLEFLSHVKPLRKLLIIRSFKKVWPSIQINYGSDFNSILGAQSSMYNPMIIVVLYPHKKVIIWLYPFHN